MLIAIFVVLWVAVLLAGFAAYGVRPDRRATGPWPRWVWAAAGTSAVLLVVVLPGLAVYYSTGERERISRTGLELTEQQIQGRDLFTSTCKRCHTLADAGAASTIGPDLDTLQPDFETTVDAVLNGRARGKGQMPAGLAGQEGAEAVASYLAAAAGRNDGS
ncbi:MAG: cytochrome c [Solirubrobacteraceae bacterium]|nr:cytochrome c [Solirubrobacteraceae bacterium]